MEASFSAQTKQELCHERMNRPCCSRAELYGMLLFCNTFSGNEVRIVTTSPAVAQRLPRLLKKAMGFGFDEVPEEESGAKRVFAVTDPDKMAQLREVYGYEPRQSVSHHVNYGVLEEPCCQAAFFRGVFLVGGSVTDPKKQYHLEFATSHYYVAREIQPLMAELGMAAKTSVRNANYVTYFKQSEAISDFLTAIGAPVAAMDVMNAKVEKHLRNKVNRRSNCDMANVDKTVAAAQEQIGLIQRVKQSPLWEGLGENLKETARLRIENPEFSLSQLAELAGISKSCLNHRMRKFAELAEKLTPKPTDE